MLKTPKIIIIIVSLLVSACGVGFGKLGKPPPPLLEEIPPAVPIPAVMGTSLDTMNAKPARATSEIIQEDGSPNIRPEPADLMGKEITFIESTFGKPTFLRWEKKIRVLQYKTPTCVLDLYFYEEGADRSLILRHFDSRGPLGNDLSPRDCIASLLPNHFWASGLDITLEKKKNF